MKELIKTKTQEAEIPSELNLGPEAEVSVPGGFLFFTPSTVQSCSQKRVARPLLASPTSCFVRPLGHVGS